MSLKEKAKTRSELGRECEEDCPALDVPEEVCRKCSEEEWVRLEDVKQIIRNILDDFGDISDYDNDDVIELHKALTKLLNEEKAKP